MFELTAEEITKLGSQNMVSGFGTSSHGGNRHRPFAFTETGVAMLSGVLNSEKAIEINLAIMRAFTQMRKQYVEQHILIPRMEAMEKALVRIEKGMIESAHQPQINSATALNPPESDKVRAIQRTVARYWGLEVEDLKSSSRTNAVSVARQVAVYFVRKHLGLSFPEIGRHFGQRDHSTIMAAFRKVESAMSINSTRETVASLQSQIQPLLV